MSIYVVHSMVLLRIGNSVTKIEGAERWQLEDLDFAMKVEYPGAEYARRYRPLWDGCWHPVDTVRGTFPTGLLDDVQKYMPLAIPVDERKRPEVLPYTPNILNDITFAEHQEKAIKIALEKGRGILGLAVGAGKTECAMAIASHVVGRCVWIVHRKDLLHQTAERIKLRTNEDAALFGDGRWDEIGEKKYVIIMPQTVGKDVRYFTDLVQDASTLILDEAHRTAAASQWYRIAQLVPAYFRIGLSGTPDTDDPVRDLRLKAVTGQILMRVRSKDLQDIGWSAKCKVVYHKLQNQPVPPGTEYMDARRILIEENPERNAEIVILAIDAANTGKPCLVICDTVRHAKIIAEILRGEQVRVRLLTGKNTGVARMQSRKDLRAGAIQVIVATNIFDEGVDIPELETVVLAAGGKSSVRMIQRLGRALRMAPGKKEAVIHDFWDTGSRYTVRHSVARLQTCRREGFTIVGAPDLSTRSPVTK